MSCQGRAISFDPRGHLPHIARPLTKNRTDGRGGRTADQKVICWWEGDLTWTLSSDWG
jgi:hypothetical protein